MDRRSFLTASLVLTGSGLLAGGTDMIGAPQTPDIVDTAIAAGSFKTLVAAVQAAVQAAGLVDTLKSPGPFTVFAPADAAFAKLPAGTVELLLLPENKAKLVAILTDHVVPGRVLAADLAGKPMDVATVQGSTVHIDGRSGVKVNNANVTTADILTSNGVIHVIDTGLLPRQAARRRGSCRTRA